jgi:hypothetical protein
LYTLFIPILLLLLLYPFYTLCIVLFLLLYPLHTTTTLLIHTTLCIPFVYPLYTLCIPFLYYPFNTYYPCIPFVYIPFVYLAAPATTQLAMRGGPTQFRPFHGPSGEQLRPLWETLHDTAIGLWPPEDREASPDTMGIIAEAQRALSQHSAQALADALLASFPPSTENGKRALARFLSCACRLNMCLLQSFAKYVAQREALANLIKRRGIELS